jgi:hypothetical protein
VRRESISGPRRARNGARSAILAAVEIEWIPLRARFAEGLMPPAELAARYLVARVRREAPRSWLQGPRRPALDAGEDAPEAVRLFATREIYRLPRAVAHALTAWSAGRREVEVWFSLPSPREVLAMQARGARCVSLLADEDVPAGPIAGLPRAHAYGSGGLAFAVHDLCHLEKFFDPETHREQRGFFAALDRALADPRFQALEASFDAAWPGERDAVLSDMNGSCAFLFVVLRSKIKLAIRRRIAAARGEECRRGEMDAEEARAYDEAMEVLLDALGLHGEARDAALSLTARAGAEEAAPKVQAFFAARG